MTTSWNVTAPASKSLSHRYCIGAALAQGDSVVRHVLESRDIQQTRHILTAAGACFVEEEKGDWHITGFPQGRPLGGTTAEPLSCDVHESGTTCRLLTAVLAAGQGVFRIHGAPRMHERPIATLVHALQELGVTIQYEETEGCPPLRITTTGIRSKEEFLCIGMDESSQYFSGLLLAAPSLPRDAQRPLTLRVGGNKAVSWPYVGLTLQCLEDFGIRFRVETRQDEASPWQEAHWRTLQEAQPHRVQIHVWPGQYRAGHYGVEGDWSGASYLLASGALGKTPTIVHGLNEHSLQGDRAMLAILQAMGAAVDVSADTIRVHPSTLHGIEVDMGACPDLVPTVALLAACAHGTTRIMNVAHLRIKESDRIAAPATELARLGLRCEPQEDGLVIHGEGKDAMQRALRVALERGERFSAHNDHRIAMALALLDCLDSACQMEQRLDTPLVVRKSFPSFWQLWQSRP